MTHWILPWRETYFDVEGCLNEFGFVEWRQTNKLSVGDIVFLYATLPTAQIKYMFEVTRVNIPYEDTVNDKYFILDETLEKKRAKYYARFELITQVEKNPALSHKKLTELGMPSSLQHGIKATGNLLKNILINLNVEFNQLTQSYTEGEATTTSITSYERNQEARNKCLSKYGYSCRICGFDFEKVYGALGHKFIHVHHINFISKQGGVSHKVDPINDLIPVCPNCHAMLHHKNALGKFLSPEDLKTAFLNHLPNNE